MNRRLRPCALALLVFGVTFARLITEHFPEMRRLAFQGIGQIAHDCKRKIRQIPNHLMKNIFGQAQALHRLQGAHRGGSATVRQKRDHANDLILGDFPQLDLGFTALQRHFGTAGGAKATLPLSDSRKATSWSISCSLSFLSISVASLCGLASPPDAISVTASFSVLTLPSWK